MKTEWNPIETAPKDGTRIILYRTGYIENIAICWYSNDFDCWVPVGGFDFTDATHWMPLPPAP